MQPNDKATIHFAVPSHLETMKFTLKREPDETFDGHSARVYRLSLDSLLSFTLPHIEVAYDAKSRQLLRFDGLSNIHGSGHRNLHARITFDPGQSRQVSQSDPDGPEAVAGWPLLVPPRNLCARGHRRLGFDG